jgi:hypothetical protein
MKKNYFRKYVTHFKLIKTGDNTFSNTGGVDVLRVVDDKILVRESHGVWKPVRTGSLVLSVINNIPLHG